MKKIAFVLLVIIVMLVGTSCVHHYPYEPEYWFQALGEDGEYVLTADVKRLQNGEGKEIVDPSILSHQKHQESLFPLLQRILKRIHILFLFHPLWFQVQ